MLTGVFLLNNQHFLSNFFFLFFFLLSYTLSSPALARSQALFPLLFFIFFFQSEHGSCFYFYFQFRTEQTLICKKYC